MGKTTYRSKTLVKRGVRVRVSESKTTTGRKTTIRRTVTVAPATTRRFR